MNRYNQYRIRKMLDKMTDKIFDTLFYIPRTLYKNNSSFKNWINKKQDLKHTKNHHKKVMNRIFYYIDKNGVCDVLLSYDFDNCLISDIDNSSINCNFLIENNDWAKKNKLRFEKMTYEEYIIQYYPDEICQLGYGRWSREKNSIIIRITKEK